MTDPEIVVVDYHKGNLLSVARSFSSVGASVEISDDPHRIATAPGIVLPGVGSFEDAMDYLGQSGEGEALQEALQHGAAFLGICLGMQVLFSQGSEHRDSQDKPSEYASWIPGLDVFGGSVTRLEGGRLKVPHVGWDQIHLSELGRTCPLFAGVPEGANFYFTHSYAVADDVSSELVVARTHYTRSFASAVWQDALFGVQFHPEKSSEMGMTILKNFLRIVRE